jgi:hypothetical protein
LNYSCRDIVKQLQISNGWKARCKLGFFFWEYPDAIIKIMAQIENFSLPQLKERAKAFGYTKIRRRTAGAPTVPLANWNGVATEAGPRFQADVWYNLDSSAVIVHKTGEPDIYYELS